MEFFTDLIDVEYTVVFFTKIFPYCFRNKLLRVTYIVIWTQLTDGHWKGRL